MPRRASRWPSARLAVDSEFSLASPFRVKEQSSPGRRKAAFRVLVFVTVVLGLFAAAQSIDLATYVDELRAWVKDLGVAAPIVFIGGYALATLLGVPGTPLTILAALLFGLVGGFVTIVIATTLASTLGFLISRYVARDALQTFLEGHTVYERLQSVVSDNQWFSIPFVRVMPVFPYALVNYALGLSRVSFGRYILASELVMIPMNALWVFSAGAVYRTVVRGEVPWPLLIGTSVLGLLIAGAGYLVRRRGHRQEGER